MFRKMTIKRKDRSYHALNTTEQTSVMNQRKLSFNQELNQSNENSNKQMPISSAQQIANIFKEPVNRAHSEGN